MSAARRLWPSPLGADVLAAGAGLIAEPRIGRDGFYWLQSIAAEGGRVAVMHAGADLAPRPLIPAPYNVRSRVNEYGGGAWTVGSDGEIWFVNGDDQALYRVRGARLERIFRRDGLALGDLCRDEWRGRVLAVAESDGEASDQSLVAIRPDGGLETLAEGGDFYAAPRLSPDGRRLAWLEWSTPDMPWDATRLLVADLTRAGRPGRVRRIGGSRRESLAQPEWSPAGDLHVVSDRANGFWNLHRVTDFGLVPVRTAAAECARPAFVFAQRMVAFTPPGGLLLAEAAEGFWRILEGPYDGPLAPRLPELTDIAGLDAGSAGVLALGAGPATPPTLFVRPRGEDEFRVLTTSLELPLDPGFVSRPQALNIPVADGQMAHALYFPPAHPEHRTDSPPPVRVRCHGGPTSAASSALEPKTLYWTSRGFAVLELNYRGSTGYGRAYREALYGRWGVADAEDACAAALELAARGLADPELMTIAGGSAGGLTVLNALAGASPYGAGASHYGVSDLTGLAETTHRFEARYGEQLIGPWPAARTLYEARSPLNRIADIARPVIFFQGLDDPVVPPAQSEAMAHALAARGIRVALETFPGERHGFRRADTIVRVLAAELAFYVRLLRLETAEALPEPRFL